jgi:hypothetical protein
MGSEQYWQAIEYLRGRPFVAEEIYDLMATLFGTPRATVEFDIKYGRQK